MGDMRVAQAGSGGTVECGGATVGKYGCGGGYCLRGLARTESGTGAGAKTGAWPAAGTGAGICAGAGVGAGARADKGFS